jgi:acyl carrier protein
MHAAGVGFRRNGCTALPFGRNFCMDVMTIENRALEIVRDRLKPARELTMETRFAEDLGADSLDMAAICMELEDEFDFAMPEEAASKASTIADLVAIVRKTQK